MKQAIIAALVSLVSGICFAVGILAVILIASNWDNPSALITSEPEFVRLPPEIRITEHANVPGTPNYTIRGVVENDGTSEWTDVGIKAAILAGGVRINGCSTDIDGKLMPKTRRAFQIECYEVAGSGLPNNISYELTVGSARR